MRGVCTASRSRGVIASGSLLLLEEEVEARLALRAPLRAVFGGVVVDADRGGVSARALPSRGGSGRRGSVARAGGAATSWAARRSLMLCRLDELEGSFG
eukprot:CAMPEP_0195137914 /NCGR_PEP_ID=MMETSP0448-20130528/156809_1 /TAXON_ID=66468 /ORGANISM="Heterocapsa triquestra, Strain CCMP 448" /LENGTH=98 /DNA_ID=CAMNT_0040176169 /DNA_START=226 /DNA_END=519 /DNA_ORIENTATION=+